MPFALVVFAGCVCLLLLPPACHSVVAAHGILLSTRREPLASLENSTRRRLGIVSGCSRHHPIPGVLHIGLQVTGLPALHRMAAVIVFVALVKGLAVWHGEILRPRTRRVPPFATPCLSKPMPTACSAEGANRFCRARLRSRTPPTAEADDPRALLRAAIACGARRGPRTLLI